MSSSFLRYCKDIANFFGYFRHAWPNPLKNILSTWRKLRCLKKQLDHWLLPWDIATVLQYFYLDYFRYAWPSPSSMTLPTCRKIWCLSAQKMNFFSHFFLEILQRSCKIVILGTLCTTSPPKLIKSTCRKFDFYLCAKINFTPPFFPEILQIYFGSCLAMTSKNDTACL